MALLRMFVTFVVSLIGCTSGQLIEWSSENELRETNLRHRRRTQESRPVMHTFYGRIDTALYAREKGMNDTIDEQMLEMWKATWSAAGWEPKVLTLEDAMRHPQFENVDKALEANMVKMSYYDRLCFIRWLAMAANGGGWMSDYDVVPINQIVEMFQPGTPNDGRMSVYDHHVPSLVSGSASEWDRMARLLVENAIQHKDQDFWSDMLAMVNLIEEHDPQVFISTRQVEIGSRVLTNDGIHSFGLDPDDCPKLADKVAIHFSHSAMLWADLEFSDRPWVATQWLQTYNERCPKVQVQVAGPTTA